MDGLETFAPHPEMWRIYAALPAAGALGSWPPLRPAPAQSAMLGTRRDLRHESAQHLHASQAGRELGRFLWRQAVITDMAKWGVGEVSGARASLVGIDKIGMLGVSTVVVDGLDGLVRLVRRSGVAHLQHHRSSVSRVFLLISGNPLRFEGGKGLRICLGMGLYQPRISKCSVGAARRRGLKPVRSPS